ADERRLRAEPRPSGDRHRGRDHLLGGTRRGAPLRRGPASYTGGVSCTSARPRSAADRRTLSRRVTSAVTTRPTPPPNENASFVPPTSASQPARRLPTGV